MIDSERGLPLVAADFNARTQDGHVWLGPEGFGRIRIDLIAAPPGTRVLLRDTDGNTCEAKVVAVQPPITLFEADWHTWRDAPEQALSE